MVPLTSQRVLVSRQCECEIEYENDFSNLVPIVSFSTGQQQGGVRALGT